MSTGAGRRRWLVLVAGMFVLGLFPWFPAQAARATSPALVPAVTATSWCVAGSFQGWDNSSTALNDTGDNGDMVAGDGIFSRSYPVASAGAYEWKIVECGNWGNAFPANNAWFTTSSANQAVTFTFDSNNRTGDAGLKLLPASTIVNVTGDTLPTSFTAVGDFQGWNNADPATALTPMGNGIHRLAYAIPNPGSYIGKITVTGSWDSFGGDGRSKDGANISFTTTAPNQTMIFLLDTRTGRVAITPNGAGTASWCLAGSFQGWNNASTPLNDTGTNGDLVGGDGVYSLDFSIAAAGRHEWKVVRCGDWGTAFPAQNAWLQTSTASQLVTFTFDTNNHAGDAGLALLPAQNIVNAWDSLPASFTAVGSFQGWNNANPDTALSNAGPGWYQLRYLVATPGSYLGKITATGTWDSFGADGRSVDGVNLSFQTYVPGATVQFVLDAFTGRLAIIAPPQPPLPGPDNNVFYDGLMHDSRDTLYRTPGGAVTPGTTVLLRFRTFHNDVTGVRIRAYDTATRQELFVPMQPAASDVDCYGPAPNGYTCDFWEASITAGDPGSWYYRFIVTDGTARAYYADNTEALDGGPGSATPGVRDWSYVITIYDAAQVGTPIGWMQDGVSYQIFPDRFRNGNPANDWQNGEPRYDDPVIRLAWGTLPEGYCRAYDGANPTTCPWRFGPPPSWGVNLPETPRGRDYYGGDLQGVTQQLPYLRRMGVTVIYFNPIFAAASNHRYDTRDYYTIAPELGTMQDWRDLVREARKNKIRIILDGVFNHLSSDSPFFDRYNRFPGVGACESVNSPYNSWFTFRAPRPGEAIQCPNRPAGQTNYDGWFGFDSIPVINKSNPAVLDYFVTSNASVTRFWLQNGADGWRMDVMGDTSFPAGYWEAFRVAVKQTNPNAIIIGELWKKGENLEFNHGDRADAGMNYRLRDGVLGFLGNGDPTKGFPDGGRSFTPSEFAARMLSIQEDYSDGYLFNQMNLLGSHDTERMIWNLTPGGQNRADKEFNAANVAIGLQRARLAALIQFSMPGAPQIYYGDEVGVTGDDDPDDRRTYPWPDLGFSIDSGLLEHYTTLGRLRAKSDALRRADLTWLLADNAAQTVAYGRKLRNEAVIVVVNRGDTAQTVAIPVGGFVPNGYQARLLYGVNGGGQSAVVQDGTLTQSLPARSGAMLVVTGDLTPPDATTGLVVTAQGNGTVSLSWNPTPGAAAYNLYRSPVRGGGDVLVGAGLAGTSFTDTGLRNGRSYFYVVRPLDASGNEGSASNEVSGLPRYTIGWAGLQWPCTITHTISASTDTPTIYGQVWIDGVTGQVENPDGLVARLGYGPRGSNPAGNPAWRWVPAQFNGFAGNNNEYKGVLRPDQVGDFEYNYRFSTDNGLTWVYASRDNIFQCSPDIAGDLTVLSTGDTSAPSTPANLRVLGASTAAIEIAWDAASDNVGVYGYEVLRAPPGGSAVLLATVVGATSYSDPAVDQGASYTYQVRALDESFNRSGLSNAVTATAEPRLVSVTFRVTVPAGTPAGMSVYIAGTLHRLDPPGPEWNPGGQALSNTGGNLWEVTLTGREGTNVEYKYTLGSWDFVEKGPGCEEIANRTLTINYGSTGTQLVSDTVANWRNVSPCGN